jgi:hypothetical protein
MAGYGDGALVAVSDASIMGIEEDNHITGLIQQEAKAFQFLEGCSWG